MKLPPFTLVYRPPTIAGEGSEADSWWRTVTNLDRTLARSFQPGRSRFARALYASFGSGIHGNEVKPEHVATLSQIAKELARHPSVVLIGLWDIGAKVGKLPKIITALNDVQELFTFFEIQAALPVGITAKPERLVKWVQESRKRPPSKEERKEMDQNVMADELYEPADTIRKSLGIDYLIGLTPYMIAFYENYTPEWGYFSWSGKRIVLASTFGLRQYADAAGCTFEVAAASVAISTLLVLLNPKLEFHKENRGCIFDFNEERDKIVLSLAKNI
jgi:hypothetical protein